MVAFLCNEVGVSASGYHRYHSDEAIEQRQKREERDLATLDLILEAYNFKGYKKGSRTIKDFLYNQYGIIMNRKKIQRIMRKYDIICPIRKANPYKRMAKSIKGHHVHDDHVKRNFKPGRPFTVLLTDITYFRFGKHNTRGFLSAMKDSQTGEIVARAASTSLKIDFVMETLDNFTKHPLFDEHQDMIVHSDQGSHYASDDFRNFLKMYNITQSMSRRGNCWDNAPMESFFGTFKDHIYLTECETIEEVLIEIDNFLDYYNNYKPQRKLDRLPPIQYREILISKQKSAIPLRESTL
jgi:transposase InsO family protein